MYNYQYLEYASVAFQLLINSQLLLIRIKPRMIPSEVTYTQDKKQFSITNASMKTWTFQETELSKPPSARYSHTSCIYGRYLYVYGGSNRNRKLIPGQDNFYRLDLQSRKWSSLDTSPFPPPRESHAAVIVQHFMYIFGGTNLPNVYDDLWVFNFNSMNWKKIEIKIKPKARYNSTLINIQNRYLFLFGGIDSFHIACSNSFIFDLELIKWIELKNVGQDCYRCFPAISHSDDSGRIYMFGGGKNALMNGNISRDLIQLIVDTNHLQLKTIKLIPSKDNLVTPPGMINHSMVELGSNLFIFGGMMEVKNEGMVSMKNVWVFKRKSATWQTFEIKSFIPVAKCSISKTLNNKLFIFGGQLDLPDIQSTSSTVDKEMIRSLHQTHRQNKSITNKLYRVLDNLSCISFPEVNKQEVVEQVQIIKAPEPQPQKVMIVQNPPPPSVPTLEAIKIPQILVSMTFIGSIANLQKHPFLAVAHIVDCANMKNATFLRITQEFNFKSQTGYPQSTTSTNQSCFYRFNFNGDVFTFNQFFASIYSVMQPPDKQDFQKQDIDFGNKIKFGGFRLGKILLFVVRCKKYRFVAMYSLEARIIPGSDTNFKVFFYVEDIENKIILNKPGDSYKSFILNFLKAHPKAANCLNLPLQNNTISNFDIYVFEPNKILTNEGHYSLQLNFLSNNDVYPLVNPKKIQFLDKLGYKISSQPDFSLQSYLGLLYLKPKMCRIFIGDDTDPIVNINYQDILDKYAKNNLISELSFDPISKQNNSTNHIHSISTYAITNESVYVQDNYGLLIYASGRLIKRFDINFGQLFERKFFKNKYKTQLFNLHQYSGIINVDSHLCKLDLLESDFEDNRLSVTTWKNIKLNLKTEEAKLRPLSEKKSVLLGLGKDELVKEMS